MPARRRCAACMRPGQRRAGGRPGCRAAAGFHLVRGLGDGRLDFAAAQVRADRRAGVRLVAQHLPGPGPRPTRVPPGDLQLGHQRDESQGVVPLPGAGHPGQWPAPGLGQQVNLAGQPAPRPAQRLPVLVIRLCPSRGPGRSAQPAPAAPDRYRPAAGAAPRPRAGAPAPRSHPPRPSTPGPRPDHTRPAAGPGSSPRSHPQTSGDAGYRRSSSSRTAPADPATDRPYGSGGRSRRSPAGDHSTGAPAADAPAAAAPAAPTHHQSGHAASACPHPPGNQSGNDPPRSTGHAPAGFHPSPASHVRMLS
jgi:hypothetical protein